MALRIREDGRILCAAMHPAEPGDTYLHDGISYRLTVEHAVIVTEPMESGVGRGGHGRHGEWWWREAVPADVVIESLAPASAVPAGDEACRPCRGTGLVTYKPAERMHNDDVAQRTCSACVGTGRVAAVPAGGDGLAGCCNGDGCDVVTAGLVDGLCADCRDRWRAMGRDGLASRVAELEAENRHLDRLIGGGLEDAWTAGRETGRRDSMAELLTSGAARSIIATALASEHGFPEEAAMFEAHAERVCKRLAARLSSTTSKEIT